MIKITATNFVALMLQYGYKILTQGELNIVGYRNQFGRPNYFDDTVSVYAKDGEGWLEFHYAATTRPGIPYLRKPVNTKGAAIMVPGQYPGYRLGLHRGKYIALVQAAPVDVYRDNDKDDVYDICERTIESGFFGINIHRASLAARLVGVDSAGCQVIQKQSDYDEFITLCQEASETFGNSFTYTLLDL